MTSPELVVHVVAFWPMCGDGGYLVDFNYRTGILRDVMNDYICIHVHIQMYLLTLSGKCAYG